jgi:hypothetical protein
MHSELERSSVIAERLRALPATLAPPLTWDEFEYQMQVRAARSSRAWGYAALAAGVAALVVGLATWSRVTLPGGDLTLVDNNPSELLLLDPRTIEQAEASERWLTYLPAEPAVVRVGTRGAVADLQDRIALMDDVLSDNGLDTVNPAHVVALRHERARLVNSLAQVRYAETLAADMP